jgi:tyrosyl-tRNA synthetase
MDTIDEILTRGVENIIPDKNKLRVLLESGKKLNIYLGIDPTATNIHVGHAVPLRKLQKFAELGHNVTFLIGDFTALIGDTSDKDSERPHLTREQIESNFQTYKRQAEKILDFDKITVKHNSDWLSKLSYAQIIELMQHFSAGEFFSRELIKKRLTEGKHVGLHEIMYPVMQGYDSYIMDTDIQLGGTDQTFNMQAGRILQKDIRNKESFIIANGFLMGTDGRKMSKTWNNAIWLTDEPNDMFGKVMSLKDELIIE